MASVYPTPHNKIWISSGRVTLYIYINYLDNLNISVYKSSCKLIIVIRL